MVDEGQNNSEKLIRKLLTAALTVGLPASGVFSGYGVLHGYYSRYTHLPLVGVPIASYFVAAGSLALVTAPVLIAAGIGAKIAHWAIGAVSPPLESSNISQAAAVSDTSETPKSSEKPKASEKWWPKTMALVAAVDYVGVIVLALYFLPEVYRLLVLMSAVPYLFTVIICTVFVLDISRSRLSRGLDYLVLPTSLLFDAPKSIIAACALGLCMAWYALGLSYLYGADLYGKVALSFGGGSPAKVEVIFRDTPDAPKLDFLKIPSTTPSGRAGSAIVCLLTPLGDDFLIYIPSQQATIILPEDQVLALKDVFKDPDPDYKCNPPTP